MGINLINIKVGKYDIWVIMMYGKKMSIYVKNWDKGKTFFSSILDFFRIISRTIINKMTFNHKYNK